MNESVLSGVMPCYGSSFPIGKNVLTSRCLPLCFETYAGLALENGEVNEFKRELKYDLIIMLM